MRVRESQQSEGRTGAVQQLKGLDFKHLGLVSESGLAREQQDQPRGTNESSEKRGEWKQEGGLVVDCATYQQQVKACLLIYIHCTLNQRCTLCMKTPSRFDGIDRVDSSLVDKRRRTKQLTSFTEKCLCTY